MREALRRDAHACLANAACRSGVQRATKSRPLLPHFGSDEGCRFPGSLASRCVLFALSSLANRTSSTRSTSRPTPPSGSLAHPPSSSFVQRGARRRRRLRLPPGSRATRLAPELDLRPRPALAWPAGCVSLARSSSHEDERGGATEPGRGPAGSRPPRPRGDQALTLTPALCAQDSLAGAASIWTRVRRAVPLAAPRCGRVAKLTSLLSASSSSSSPHSPSPFSPRLSHRRRCHCSSVHTAQLPNEEKPHQRTRVSPSSRSPASDRPPSSGGHHHQHQHHQHHLASSPSSTSSYSHTPDSSNSPRDRLQGSQTLHPAPPSSASSKAPATRISPSLNAQLGLYPDPHSPATTYASLASAHDDRQHYLEPKPSGVTAPGASRRVCDAPHCLPPPHSGARTTSSL